jgi:hypothetical protein
MLNSPCPSCGYRFGLLKRPWITACLGLIRRTVNCPGCGADVIWSRVAWRMTTGGMVFALTILPVSDMMGWDDASTPEVLWWGAFVLLGLCVCAVGILTLHFEKAGTATICGQLGDDFFIPC